MREPAPGRWSPWALAGVVLAVLVGVVARFVATSPLWLDEALSVIAGIAGALRLTAVQLHRIASRVEMEALRARIPGTCEIWKAIPVGEGSLLPDVESTGADRIVLDTAHETLAGGTGARFDWSRLAAYRNRERIVLAGGIDASNAGEASALGCGVIDLASGVERSPGIKDPARLEAFFRLLRGAA